MLQKESFPGALNDESFKGFEGRARFLHAPATSSAVPSALADPDIGLGFSSDRPWRIFSESDGQAELQEERIRSTSEKLASPTFAPEAVKDTGFTSLQSEQEEIHGLPLR